MSKSISCDFYLTETITSWYCGGAAVADPGFWERWGATQLLLDSNFSSINTRPIFMFEVERNIDVSVIWAERGVALVTLDVIGGFWIKKLDITFDWIFLCAFQFGTRKQLFFFLGRRGHFNLYKKNNFSLTKTPAPPNIISTVRCLRKKIIYYLPNTQFFFPSHKLHSGN